MIDEDVLQKAAEEVLECVIKTSHNGMTLDSAFRAAGAYLAAGRLTNAKAITNNVKRLVVSCMYMRTRELEAEKYLYQWTITCLPIETELLNRVNYLRESSGSLFQKRRVSEIKGVFKYYTTKKEETMKTKAQTAIQNSPKVTVTYVYGQVVVDMSADSLQNALRQVQDDQESLAHVADTKFGKRKLAELKDAATTIKALLDRHSSVTDGFTA